MKIYLDGKPYKAGPGAHYSDIVALAFPTAARRVLGVSVAGQTLSLSAPATSDTRAVALRYQSEEGARIYERSLRFVFLMAVRQLYPEARVRMENSTQTGVYARVEGISLTNAIVKGIEQRMRTLVEADLPFERQDITRTQAIEYFRKDGQMDKVRLLKYRPFEHFTLYRCGDMLEYFYGEMAPSTGYVDVFRLDFYLPGVAISLPSRTDPARPAAFMDQPKLMRTFAQTAQWAGILGCENAADLNEMVAKRKLREFIRVNEALQEKAIMNIAERFIASGAQLILVAGPSSSGKTTFAHRLQIALRVHGLRPMKLSLDDYYIDRDKIPLDENGQADLERLDTLDVPLFNEHLVRLLQGEEVQAPEFDFVAGRRSARSHALQLEPGQPVLVEGIHALNDQLTEQVPRDRKFLIYVSALTTLNLDDHNRIRTTDARLLRRMVRDHQFRGTSPEGTLSMWDSVRRGEENYIFPYQERADVMFNSSLVYELSILKKYAYPMLLQISVDSPYYTRARALIKFLNYIQTADVQDEIPINSILREFIGGCCFYREDD